MSPIQSDGLNMQDKPELIYQTQQINLISDEILMKYTPDAWQKLAACEAISPSVSYHVRNSDQLKRNATHAQTRRTLKSVSSEVIKVLSNQLSIRKNF